MESPYQENAKVFKALCDPKRLAILEQLRSGEKCACVLQEPMDLTQSGLSYHANSFCDWHAEQPENALSFTYTVALDNG